jgi:hypothetical protein
MPDLSASQLVALAEEHAPWILSRRHTFAGGTGYISSTGFNSYDLDGEFRPSVIAKNAVRLPSESPALMSVELTRENIASLDALKRALLASAAVYDVANGEYRVTIGDDSYSIGPGQEDSDGNPRRLTRVTDAEAQRLWETARDILIEHLLAPTAAR